MSKSPPPSIPRASVTGVPPGWHVSNAGHPDPYQASGRYQESTLCCDCGAHFHAGHWAWDDAPDSAAVARCPACRRMRDKLPAGTLVLEGPFVQGHQQELLELIQDEAEHERRAHPMQRLMEVVAHPHRIQCATTDIEMPQLLGEAVRRMFDGVLTVRVDPLSYCARAYWRR